MRNFITIFLIYALYAISPVKLIGGEDPKCPTPAPEPCCPDNYSQAAVYTLIDPKGNPRTLGEMTYISINGPNCIEWNWPQSATFTAIGGDDKDVCVPNGTGSPIEYDVSEIIGWSCSAGYQDPNNPRQFIFNPYEPPDPDKCQTYTITVTATNSGECNFGDESRTYSKEISVWKCKYPTRSSSGTYFVFFLCKDPGCIQLVTYYCDSHYKDCNGTFTGKEQSVSAGLSNARKWDFSAEHRFILGSNEVSVSSLGTCNEGCIMQPADKCKCSYDTSQYSYEDIITNGLNSRFILGPFIIYTAQGSCPGTPYTQIIDVNLDVARCCE